MAYEERDDDLGRPTLGQVAVIGALLAGAALALGAIKRSWRRQTDDVRDGGNAVRQPAARSNAGAEHAYTAEGLAKQVEIWARVIPIPTPVAGYPGGYQTWWYCSFVASGTDHQEPFIASSPKFLITKEELAGDITKTGERAGYVENIYQALISSGWQQFHAGRFWYSFMFSK